METRILAPLIVFALLAQLAGALPLVPRAEVQQPTVFNYIIRDPNIVPGGVFRDPMMGEANTLNPWMYTTSWEYMILGVVYDT
ncbi:MAG: hypothetical protein ACP5GP_06600, partial [Thermogladius sp.]